MKYSTERHIIIKLLDSKYKKKYLDNQAKSQTAQKGKKKFLTETLIRTLKKSWVKCLRKKTRFPMKFVVFWQCWSLNSEPHYCYASALQLEPLHQPFFVLSIFKIGSWELFAWDGLMILLISAS
jgi:hypothetical protein